MTNHKVAETLACGYAWDMGAPPAYASNVAIFLLEWVTCTDYSHPLGCPCGCPYGCPCSIGVILCVSPACILRLYRSYRICQQLSLYKFFIYYIVDILVLN